MQHKEYWAQRFDQLTNAQLNKGSEYYYNLEEQYRIAIDNIEKDIAKWYARYATENGISLTEAKRLLNSRELAEFRMDVKEYVKKGESLDPQWAKQLEAASVRVHVSRLEALKIQMQQQAENVMGGQVDGLDKLAREIYTDGYYHTAYEIQKGIGVGFDLMQLDTKKIDKLISKPWAADGKNFSDRVWANKTQLVSELENTLTQSIVRGESPKKAIDAISKRMNVSKAKAGRLIMTESAYFASAAQQDCFNDLDVEQFEVVATLDSRTSETCRHMDGKVLPMKDYKPGVTAPPFHVNCRSTTVPYFDDEFTEGEQRAARDEKGEYYTVPADMKYPEWEKVFVKGGSKEGLEPAHVEQLTLADKVGNIRTVIDEKKKAVSTKTVEIKALETQKGGIVRDNTALMVKQGNIAKKRQQYDAIVGRNLETEIKDNKKAQEDLKAEEARLAAISDRYYNGKPDRTVDRDAWLDWREWRKTVDINDVFNKQVKIGADLSDLKRKADELDDLMYIKNNFSPEAAIKELGNLQNKINKNTAAVKEIDDKVATLKTEVARLPAEIEKQIKAAGKEVVAEIKKNEAVIKRSTRIKELDAENRRLAAEYTKVSNTGTRAQLLEAHSKWVEAYNELKAAKDAGHMENAREIKSVLSEIREMGSGDLDVLGHLNNTKSKHKGVILKAYDIYPKDWVEKSIQRGKLSVKAAKRGYYSESTHTIAISGNNIGNSFATAVHEIGHRFERAVPEILQAEKAFYERRTAGEALQWLGANYRKDEKARFDDFMSKYMGKDYGGSAYELVSMGFEWGYTNPAKLMEDEDMAEWIYGLLAVY